MKNRIVLIALLAIMSLSAGAQVFPAQSTNIAQTGPTRGIYGLYQPWATKLGQICAVVSNTVTPVAAGKLDTLGGGGNLNIADTGFMQWYFPSRLDIVFDFTVTKISGTVAATALLQGSFDNATWNTITGTTTACAGCIGASATVTNTAGTKHYQWHVQGGNFDYPYWQVQVITTPTCTATYNGNAGYKY